MAEKTEIKVGNSMAAVLLGNQSSISEWNGLLRTLPAQISIAEQIGNRIVGALVSDAGLTFGDYETFEYGSNSSGELTIILHPKKAEAPQPTSE